MKKFSLPSGRPNLSLFPAGLLLTALLFSSVAAFAQDDLDSEFSEANSTYQEDAPAMEPLSDSTAESFPGASTNSFGDSSQGPIVGAGVTTPTATPTFVKPEGPKKGGSMMVPHPLAGKGLIRIEKDGSYQYKTQQLNKNQATSVRVASSTPPKISGNNLSYGDIYGNSELSGLLVDYEWQPFRGYGALGLQLGAGIMLSRGNGRFGDFGVAKEVYDLYIVPISAFLIYRFEYLDRQWFVPYISGGSTFYGLVEKRDDSKPAKFATAPAGAFSGGIHFSISRWDSKGAFIMQKEYGVADLWLTLELRIVQGLRSDIDFTNRTASAGITVDY